MSIRMGHASISENGTVNGARGDQTGREVCVRSWFSMPWDFMAVHPSATVREKHAKAVEAGCANNNIGYSQNDRNSLNAEAKKVGYDLSKVGKCNTDCSEFMNVCAIASGAPGVTHASNGWTTSTMRNALKAAGYKIITDSAYLANSAYCVRGAIYVKSGSHTACGLDSGSGASKTLAKAGIESATPPQSSPAEKNAAYKGKGIGTAVAKCTINIRDAAGTSGKVYASISKGTTVEVLEVLSSGWYKIVWEKAASGYAYTSNREMKYYEYTAKKADESGDKKTLCRSVQYDAEATEAVKVRAWAGTENAECSFSPFKKGERFGVCDSIKASDGTAWLYVKNSAGKYGFVHSGYVKKV